MKFGKFFLTSNELVDYVGRPFVGSRTVAASYDADLLDCHFGSADSGSSAPGIFSSRTCKASFGFAVQEARFSFHAGSGLLTLCSTRGPNRSSRNQPQRR